MFQGYTGLVWVVVLLQGVGGLVVAAVIKYADNILKSFANALSIMATGLISYAFMADFELSAYFFVGAPLVVYASYLWGSGVVFFRPKVKTVQGRVLPV